MQTRSWLAKWFTRLYARTINFGGVTKEETYQSHGEQHRVFWIDAEKWPMSGQYTPFRTILLNEEKLNRVSDEVVDYVFLHEVGHSKPPSLVHFSSFAIRVPLMGIALLGLPVLALRWLVFALSGSVGQFFQLTLAFVLVSLIILGPLILVSWLDEGHAEVFAVSKIGEEAYYRCHKEIRENSDSGRIARVLHRLFYPSPGIVIRVRNRLDSLAE